jgi:hypothetical protein
MLSRALSPATVTLLIGCFAAVPAQAQNLEAGKSPSQIFAGTCSACHKSPRGLLKTVPAGSLPGFLRQHYTTSSDMASLLSAFLVSNGAADTRYVGTQSKPDKDAKSEAKPNAAPEQFDRHGRRLRPSAASQEAAKPDAPSQDAKPGDEPSPPPYSGRQGRKRLARPGEAPDAAKPAVDSHAPAHSASERGPDGRKSTPKQRLSKRGRPGGEELPKSEAAKPDSGTYEPSKSEPVKDYAPKSDTAGDESGKEGAMSSGEGKSEAAKLDAPKQTGGGETPADPVPAVTPAPRASPMAPATASSGTPEPASVPAAPSAPAVTASVPPPAPVAPAVTASVPPPAPVAPAGPPAPPISQ